MAKIKLTKGELKRQRDSLQQFRHFLPTLLLKKQQLQMKIQAIRTELAQKESALKIQEDKILAWAGLLADPALPKGFDLRAWVLPETKDIIVESVNIAGVNIPVLQDVRFPDQPYDLFQTPYWIDRGIRSLRAYVRLLIDIQITRRQVAVLARELQVTTQRVNLFEKVKIPECVENIRVIRIYLGDQQTNAVGISKVAKKKIAEAEQLAVV